MKKYHVIGILQRIRRLFLILRKNQFLYVLGISYYFVCILPQICYNWVFKISSVQSRAILQTRAIGKWTRSAREIFSFIV